VFKVNVCCLFASKCYVVSFYKFAQVLIICILDSSPATFRPMSILWPANGWMDQDAIWYGGRPRPRRHCVRWEPSSTTERGTVAPPFGPLFSGTGAHVSNCWTFVQTVAQLQLGTKSLHELPQATQLNGGLAERLLRRVWSEALQKLKPCVL